MTTFINNRYKIIRELGRGGMASVYLVEDTASNNDVMALKQIQADLLGSRNLAQFKYEFAALKTLNHPNLITVYDFEVFDEGHLCYFTMAYIPGEDLSSLATKQFNTATDFNWLYEIIVQVCRALQYVHARGLIHHDIKPQNIRYTPDGQVKLMDFGLIDKATDEVHLSVRGTPEYMAPEVIQGNQVDHRVDLYALGVTLYEVVSGQLPFRGDNTTAILKQHLENIPQPPQNASQTVPLTLQKLILTLMAKTPLKRFATANTVIQAVNYISHQNFPLETEETTRAYLQSGQFVGRDRELAHLQAVLNRLPRNQGRLILVSGAAGVGKTRLVRELKLKAQLSGTLVFEGICRRQVRVPYHPWLTIFNQAIAYQQRHQPDSIKIHAAVLAELLPGLKFETQGEGGALSPIVTEKNNLLEAAARLLQTTKRPILLILDDLHHADPETVNMLSYLGEQAPENRWLLCGLYRDEMVESDHLLRPLIRRARLVNPLHQGLTPIGPQPHDLIQLHPFNSSDTAAFVQSMLGVTELPDGLLPHLLDYTGGNVRFIRSIMYNLLEQGGLQHTGRNWQIDVTKLTDLPTTIRETAQQTLASLTRESQALLQWASVMGNTIDLDVLAKVCKLDAAKMVHLIAQAKQKHILEMSEQGGETRYRFSNEHLREAIYNTLSPKQMKRYHAEVGQALRAYYPDEEIAEALAWHFAAAQDVPHALKYAKLAADKDRMMYANDLAIQHYTVALALMKSSPKLDDDYLAYDILAGRAACYSLQGNYPAQQADLEQMAATAKRLKDLPKQVGAHIQQARLNVQIGNYKQGFHLAENALKLAEEGSETKLAADSLAILGWSSYYLSEMGDVQQYCEAAIKHYHSLNDRAGEAECLRWLAAESLRSGQVEIAQKRFEQVLAIHRDLRNRKGEADALNALGVVSITRDYAQGRRYHEQSLKIVDAIGDRNGQARSLNNLSILYWAIGLYTRARDYTQQATQIGREIQNRYQLSASLETSGRIFLSIGDYAQAQQVLQEGLLMSKEMGDQHTIALYRFMLGRVALAREQIDQAQSLFINAVEILTDLQTPGELATTTSWLSTAYLALGEWDEALTQSSQALEHLKIAGGKANEYPTQDIWWNHYQILKTNPARPKNYPIDDEGWHILEMARQTMLDTIITVGDEGLRRNYLNKVEINRQIIAEWTRQARLRGYTDEEVLGAVNILAVDPSGISSARIEERLKRVLDISSRMSAMREVDALLNYTMDEVIELTGAERSFLVLIDETGRPDFKALRGLLDEEVEEARNQISYSVIGSVAQTLSPVLLQDALSSEQFSRQSSVLDLNLRSVLCVPLVARGRLIGVIYLDNRAVSGRFTQGDVDLMTIFASQAAISIENARLYEELEDWAQTLEKRVEERTTELHEANIAISRHLDQLETSSQVSQQITSILDSEELLGAIVKLIQARFGYYFVGVWLISQHQVLVLQAMSGQMDSTLTTGFTILLREGSITAQAYLTGEPQLVNDVNQSEDYMALTALPNTQSELALPMQQHDEVLGVLSIQSDRLAAFTREDQLVLQTLAGQIAIAINNAKLYKSEQARRHLAESLERTGRALTSTLDIHQVPGLILEQLMVVIHYERGSLMMQHGDKLRPMAKRGYPPEEAENLLEIALRPGDVFDQVVRTQRYLIIDDVTRESGWQQLPWLPTNRSWLGAPIITQGKVIGLFSLTRREAGQFTDDDGRMVQAFATQAAVALENAHLYDEITQFKNHLEQMVDERTQELNRAYHNLERLDEAKTDFIKVISHELRTPLTVIDGYTQILNYDTVVNTSENAKNLVTGILEGTRRMLDIINTILDVTKIDNQVLELSMNQFQLNFVLEKVTKHLAPALKERNLGLTLDNLPDYPAISGDPELINKAFYHLLINAIKYTPDGGEIRLTGRIIEKNNEPETIEVVVSDTGIGIEPDKLDLIFEKFYQTGEVALHSSGKATFRGGGPGLGLAIAKGVIQGHGGRIWAESPGYDEAQCPGSHFYVQLPIGGIFADLDDD